MATAGRTTSFVACGAVVAVLAVSGCGGSADDPVATDGVDEAAGDSDANQTDSSFDPEVVRLASSLVGQLGSDDAAVDALILSMDAGHSTEQILAGLEAGGLRADGSIDGQSPAGPALGRASGGDAGEGAATRDTMVSAVMLVSMVQPPITPIEKMRDVAQNSGARVDRDGSILGLAGTAQIIELLRFGFSADDVIEALIFGIDGREVSSEDGELCGEWRVADEVYGSCGKNLRARENAGSTASSSR